MRLRKMSTRMLAAFWVIIMALTIVPASAIQVAAETEEEAQLTISIVSAVPGETVELVAVLGNAPAVKSMAISNITYDAAKMTLLNVEWLCDAEIKNWNSAQGRGVLTFGANTDANGPVFKMTFKINDVVEDSDVSVSCSIILKTMNASGDEVSVATTVIPGKVEIRNEIPGDMDGNEKVNSSDAVYLLYHTLFGKEEYPVKQSGDIDGNGKTDSNDAVYLLYHILFGEEDYPLHGVCSHSLSYFSEQAPTCTEDGNIAYWHCTDCGKYYCNENALIEISLEETIIAATGHTYSHNWSSDATYHWHGSTCGHSDVYTDRSIHTFNGTVCTICSFDKSVKLGTPIISHIEYDTVYWEPVNNADLYLIRINGDYEYQTRNTYCEIAMVRNAMGNGITLLTNKEPITINVQVMAIGYDNYMDSNWSSIDNSYVYVPVSNDGAKIEELANYRLGYGYNLVEDEYLRIANASRYSVLDVGKLLTLGQYTRTDNTKGYSDYYSYSSVDEFMSKRENNFDASVGVKIPLAGSLKAQLSSSMSEHYSSYSYNEMFVADVGITIADHQLLNLKDEYLKYCMSVDFLKVIYRQTPETENLTDEELVEYIYERYGTHIILGVTTGGSYLAQYTVSTNNENIASTVKNSFNLTGAVNIQKILEVDIGINVSGSQETEWKTSTTEAHFNVAWAGGTAGATTNPANLDSAIQSWTQSVSNNPVSVRFTEEGAISMSALIRTVDSALADAFEEYVDSKTDATYKALYAQYDKNLNRLVGTPYTEDGKTVIKVDLSSFQREGSMESAYDPNFLDNILTIYPVMYGVRIDKIIVDGAFNDAVAQSELIDKFSLALSKEWNRDVEIIINNLGIVCASEQGVIDLSEVTKNIQVDIAFTGVNMIEETDGECRFAGAINGMPYEFYFDVQNDVFMDYSTIQIDGSKLYLPVAERASYTFMGWYTADEILVADSLGEMINALGSMDEKVVLYAKWDPMTFKIVLDDQGANTVGTQSIFEKYNQGFYSDFEGTTDLAQIIVPEKTGYVFGGYYGSVENNGTASAIGADQYILADGTIVALTAAFSNNSTLYALWIPEVYTISLDGQGATILGTSAYYEMYSVGVYGDTECSSSLSKIVVPQRDGYVFAGYFEGEKGTGAQRIMADGTILSNANTYTKNVTLYALWIKNIYTIGLDPNGATLSGTTAYYQKYGEGIYADIECTLAISWISLPIRPGYTFQGYYWNDIQYIDEKGMVLASVEEFTSNVTLVAKWLANTYTVHYDANKPSNASANVTSMPTEAQWTYDADAVLASAPELAGWIFCGWYRDPACTIKAGNAEVVLVSPNYSTQESVTLYAKWEAQMTIIAFDANGGVEGTQTKHVIYDSAYGVLPTVTKEGYAFVGWFTANGIKVTESTIASKMTMQTLYAHWTAIVDTVECSIDYSPGLTRDQTVTNNDGVIETIKFENIDVATLNALGYQRVKLVLVLDAKEQHDGYQEFWISRRANSDSDDLVHHVFEHRPGDVDKYWYRYTFEFDFAINELFNDNGEICIEYGAHGSNEKNTWYLGYTVYSITAYK